MIDDRSRIQYAPAGDLQLAYETFGDPGDVPIVLVMGLATQMIGWPEELCEDLAARGHFVVRFDNRDIGLSSHLDDAPPADLGAAMTGDTSSAAYTLTDMARDVIHVMDALGFESAHVVGASMGGMIAQTVAIEHPERVRSLTSLMSTTGDRSVGAPSQAAIEVLLAPPARTREEAQERAIAGIRVIGSPGFERDEADLRERVGIAYDRAHDPAGVGRQLMAILASADRTPRLAEIKVPVGVIHGADDALIGVSGGRATAAAIPGAELHIIDGWGHDFPKGVLPELAERISAVVARGEAEPRAEAA
jgi:pimeloyl-ACP methyl ester carboxylesterase